MEQRLPVYVLENQRIIGGRWCYRSQRTATPGETTVINVYAPTGGMKE